MIDLLFKIKEDFRFLLFKLKVFLLLFLIIILIRRRRRIVIQVRMKCEQSSNQAK